MKGDHKGRIAAQTLSRDKRGVYHLSTTFQEYGGEHVPLNIHEDAPLEVIEVLVGSVFMRKLIEIAQARDRT